VVAINYGQANYYPIWETTVVPRHEKNAQLAYQEVQDWQMRTSQRRVYFYHSA
jgi:hypothetical protein